MEIFLAFLDARTPQVGCESVDKTLIIEYLRQRANRGVTRSRSVWNTHLSALRAFYGYLFREEVIMDNPALRVERMKPFFREPTPLSLDEAVRLTEAVEEHAQPPYRARNEAIVQVLFHCALRVAELVSLDLAQVDFDNYVFVGVRTKGGKHLSVAFNDVVAEALGKYLTCRQEIVGASDIGALFLSDRRTRISIRAVQDLVRRYAELAGISRRVSPHLLRHSSATQLVEIGTPLSVVQEMCGHASVTTTQRYVHVSGGQRRHAVDALGAEWRRHAVAKRVSPDSIGTGNGTDLKSVCNMKHSPNLPCPHPRAPREMRSRPDGAGRLRKPGLDRSPNGGTRSCGHGGNRKKVCRHRF